MDLEIEIWKKKSEVKNIKWESQVYSPTSSFNPSLLKLLTG